MDERYRKALSALDEQIKIQSFKNPPPAALHRPWFQNDYVQRVKTFHWYWANRPSPADAVTCARFGWYQPDDTDDMNSIICCGCRGRIYLPWDDDLLMEAKRELSLQYFSKIKDHGHESYCPWKIAPCHEGICKASFLNLSLERKLIQDNSLTFEDIKVQVLLSDQRLEKLLSKILDWYKDVHSGSLVMALTQWRREDNLVKCRFNCCEYSVDFIIESASFDPLESHAWYCPLIYDKNAAWNDYTKLFLSTSNDFEKKNIEHNLYSVLTKFTCNEINETL